MSKALNQSSDELTKHLSEIQSKVNDLHLGLEVWVDTAIYQSDLGKALWEMAYLGYGKCSGNWALLVKETTVIVPDEDADFDSWKTESIFIRPLLEAPRFLRVNAVAKIESLFKELENEAQRVSAAITKAAELAEK